METSATNRRIRLLLTGIRDKTLVPNPHFQRRLVWSNTHKTAFLSTVLEGLPFPEIFISAGEVNPDTGDGTELIVDGQQRVTTLNQYFTGSKDLKLGNSGLVPYAVLTDEQKRAFLEYQVVIRDLGPMNEEDTREIFHKINSTAYSLNAMEVNNSRFDGELKRFAERVAEDSFFESHKVFTGLDGRRMNDVRFALTLVITMISGYFNRDDEHESYLEQYNNEFPQADDVQRRLSTAISFIDAMKLGQGERAWQKADLLTLLVEVDQALQDGVDFAPGETHDALSQFYTEVEEVTRTDSPSQDAAEYYRRVRSGINDRISRFNRGEALAGRLRHQKGF